jgi:hypothetical protein
LGREGNPNENPPRNPNRIPAPEAQPKAQHSDPPHSTDFVPMKNEIPFPDGLPKLPEAPAGMRWVYRGVEFSKDAGEFVATADYWCGFHPWTTILNGCGGAQGVHYAEAVPIETEPDYSSREYQKSVLDAAWDGAECEYWQSHGEYWQTEASGFYGVASALDCGLKVRIKPTKPEPAPDPYAELKAAHAAGKVIQRKWDQWEDFRDVENPDWSLRLDQYRIKPEPITVPLEASDCIGALFLSPGGGIYGPTCIDVGSVYFHDTTNFSVTFDGLKNNGWKISHNRAEWSPCHKPAK